MQPWVSTGILRRYRDSEIGALMLASAEAGIKGVGGDCFFEFAGSRLVMSASANSVLYALPEEMERLCNPEIMETETYLIHQLYFLACAEIAQRMEVTAPAILAAQVVQDAAAETPPEGQN